MEAIFSYKTIIHRISYLLILILIVLPIISFSQIVISENFVKENDEPMTYPQIIVKSDTIVIGATTDLDGNFKFSIV